ESGQHALAPKTTTPRSAKWRWRCTRRRSGHRAHARSTTTHTPAHGVRQALRSESGHRNKTRSTTTPSGSARRQQTALDQREPEAPKTTARPPNPPKTPPPQPKYSWQNSSESSKTSRIPPRNYNLYITPPCTRNTPRQPAHPTMYTKTPNP